MARFRIIILTLISLSAIGMPAGAQDPSNPHVELLKKLRAEIDAHLETPAVAAPIRVTDGANLQAAIDAAPEGATLLLPSTATFTGPITCRRSLLLATADVQVQGRVGPATALATLTSPDTRPTYTAAQGSTGCRLERVRVIGWLQIGAGVETVIDRLPTEATIRQVVVEGRDSRRCVALNARRAVVVESHISGCRDVANRDSQAISINQGAELTIRGNYLEAVSENIMIGGDRPYLPDHVPSDILVEDNDVARPLTWKDQEKAVKNLIEAKTGRRITIRGNRLSGIWRAAQTGYALMLTPRNQYGDAPQTILEDIVVEGNTVTQASGGINITGDDDLQPSQRTTRVTIRNNRMVLSKVQFGGTGACLIVGRGPQALVVEQNTCLTDGTTWDTYGGGAVTTVSGARIARNIFGRGTYGFRSDKYAEGAATLAGYYPGAVWEDNVIGGGTKYPAGTRILTSTALRAEFSDYDRAILKPESALVGLGAP